MVQHALPLPYPDCFSATQEGADAFLAEVLAPLRCEAPSLLLPRGSTDEESPPAVSLDNISPHNIPSIETPSTGAQGSLDPSFRDADVLEKEQPAQPRCGFFC